MFASSRRKRNNKARPKKQVPIESTYQLIKPGYDPLVPRISKIKVSELTRVKLTNTLDDNVKVSRLGCVTEGKNLEEVLCVLAQYKQCGKALLYDASDMFENADCILENIGYDNFITAKLEIEREIKFNENNKEHWNLVVKRLYTKYGVNEDSLREFYEYISGLKKPYAWTPLEFLNRADVLLRYWEQLGGKPLDEEEKIALQKKILLHGVPPDWTKAWMDLSQSLAAVPIEELTRFMNEQRMKNDNLVDSSSSDEDEGSHLPQQKKHKPETPKQNHSIIEAQDRCPHCKHKHTWDHCRRFNPEAPGFWGFDKYNTNGQNGSRRRPFHPSPPNNSGAYGHRSGNYGGPTHQGQYSDHHQSHHFDRFGQPDNVQPRPFPGTTYRPTSPRDLGGWWP